MADVEPNKKKKYFQQTNTDGRARGKTHRKLYLFSLKKIYIYQKSFKKRVSETKY